MRTIVFTLITLMISMAYAKTKVAVIDSGFSSLNASPNAERKLCKKGHRDFTTGEDVLGMDDDYHGTAVVNLIAENAPDADFCIVMYKIVPTQPGITYMASAIKHAIKNNVHIINLSLVHVKHSFTLKSAIQAATKKGIKIFVAAGNDHTNLNDTCTSYPTCFRGVNDNLISVGAENELGGKDTYTNFGEKVGVYEYGTIPNGSKGTSFATPRAVARFLRERK